MIAHQLIKEQRRTDSVLITPGTAHVLIIQATAHVLTTPGIAHFVAPSPEGCIIQVERLQPFDRVCIYGLTINSTNHSWTVSLFDNQWIALSYTLNKLLAQLFVQSKTTCILFYLKPRTHFCQRSFQIYFHNENTETVELNWSSVIWPDTYPCFPKTRYPGLMQIGDGLGNPGHFSEQNSARILTNFMLVDCPRSFKSFDLIMTFQCIFNDDDIFNDNEKQNWVFPMCKRIKLLSTKFATIYAIPQTCSSTPLFLDDRFVKKWMRSLKSNQPLENLQSTWNPVVLPKMKYYYFDMFDATKGEAVNMREQANPIRVYFLTTDNRWT